MRFTEICFRTFFVLMKALRGPRRRQGLPQTVLVLQYAMPVGCCVHGTPLLAAIRSARPDVTIIVATHGNGLAALLHDPYIDHLIETPAMTSRWKVFAIAGFLRKRLRQKGLQPDIVLQDASSVGGSYALLALVLRVAPTAGFAHAPLLYDIHLDYDLSLSLLDNTLRLAPLVGAESAHLEPAIYFSEADLDTARALLREVNPADLPLVGFVVQGRGPKSSRWPEEHFAEVLRYVRSLGYCAVFLGIASDTERIDRVRTLAGGYGASLAGRTSIPELTAVLCLCDLLVTLDTGIMHVARSTDLPMVVLGTAWQEPLEWMPLNKKNVRIIRGEEYEDLPVGYHTHRIDVNDVLQAIAELRHAYPASSHARDWRVSHRLSTRSATPRNS